MRNVRFAWRNGPISFRGLLASSVSQRNGRSVRLSSPLRSGVCVEKKLRESALKSRESFARVNLRVGACPARPSSSCGLVCSTVRDDADVEGAEIREKRLAFAVAGEMNEIFDLARASSRTNSSAGPEPTNELGARRRGRPATVRISRLPLGAATLLTPPRRGPE